MVRFDINDRGTVDEVNARYMNSASIKLVQSGNTQPNRVVSVWRPGSKHALLLTSQLRRLYLGLPWVVVAEAHVEDKDYPDVAEAV